MDILVISDSHGRADRIETLLSVNSTHGAIFFLGDGLRDLAWIDTHNSPVYSVCGNCDLSSFCDDEILTELAGKRIFAAHGHKYSVKSGYERMVARAASLGADIMLFGHTHSPLEKYFRAGECVGETVLSKDLYVLNPGSLGYDRTFGVITVRDGKILTSIGKI